MVSLGLLLELLAAVYAEQYVALPKFLTKAQSATQHTGSVVEDGYFSWTTQLPVSDFNIAAWAYVTAAHDNVIFIQINDSGESLNVQWPSTADATATLGGVTATATGVGNRPNGKWFHLVAGVGGDNLFIVVSLRQTTNFQFPGQTSKTFSLTASAEVEIPVVTEGSITMTVSHT